MYIKRQHINWTKSDRVLPTIGHIHASGREQILRVLIGCNTSPE